MGCTSSSIKNVHIWWERVAPIPTQKTTQRIGKYFKQNEKGLVMAIRKIYKDLSKEDKEAGVIFSSTLSMNTVEQPDDNTHKVYGSDDRLKSLEAKEDIRRLKDTSFFNHSHFKYNIIRT
jgi:hypothetical protein